MPNEFLVNGSVLVASDVIPLIYTKAIKQWHVQVSDRISQRETVRRDYRPYLFGPEVALYGERP